MNQILSTVPQPKKGGKMKKNKASIKVSSDSKKVTRVFAIILLLFGIFIIGSGSYALYKGESTKNEQIATLNKPVISVESVDETGSTILLKVTSEIGIDKVVYQWNDANTTTLSANGSKYFEQKIQVPNGTNNLNINVTDIQGQEGTYSKKYEVNSNISIEQKNINLSHNHTITGTKSLTIHNALKVGDKVILIQVQGGQRYIVLDKVY